MSRVIGGDGHRSAQPVASPRLTATLTATGAGRHTPDQTERRVFRLNSRHARRALRPGKRLRSKRSWGVADVRRTPGEYGNGVAAGGAQVMPSAALNASATFGDVEAPSLQAGG